jgi:hypothetical protein
MATGDAPTGARSLDPRLLAILACPEDKGPLHYLGEGIPVMLVDEAITVDDEEHAAIMARIEAEGIAPTFTPAP